MTVLTTPLDPGEIRSTIDRVLCDFFDQQEQQIRDLPELKVFTGMLRDLLAAGGKRVRPVLCVAGWYAIRDQPPPSAVWRAAASLELFHTFALIHDDVMDQSDTRRGRPTAHRALAARHAGHLGADALGVNSAILLGDLAFGWSYELLHSASGPTADVLSSVWALLNDLRRETLAGQYLDLVAAGRPVDDVDIPWRIIRYKTAKYTVERPLHLGATLAGAAPDQLDALSAYALPLGEAFQLRDDLLGVFGDPGRTGKGTLDDLREGKHTVLIATAFRHATELQQQVLRNHVGDPDLSDAHAEEIRTVLTTTGARAASEELISDKYHQALDALTAAALRPSGSALLRHFADTITTRTA